MELVNEEKQREILSQSILDANLRLTHDHELSNLGEDDIRRRIVIDYNNELQKLYLRKLSLHDEIINKQINLYENNKDKIINYRLARMLQKKELIKQRSKEDWKKLELQYRREELEHLRVLTEFKPSLEVIYIRRANFNDIRLMRNYIRTISYVEGNINDDNVISKYRNLEFKLRSNENYVVIETIDYNNEIYGYLVNKHNYLDRLIIRIKDYDNMLMIDLVDNGYKYDQLLSLFLKKVQ